MIDGKWFISTGASSEYEGKSVQRIDISLVFNDPQLWMKCHEAIKDTLEMLGIYKDTNNQVKESENL